MKFWILTALLLSLNGCANTAENENAGHIPQAMECPASQDPSQGCPSPSAPAITLGQQPPAPVVSNKAAAAARVTKRLRSITGRCELLVEGERKPRSCSEIDLMVRSPEVGEMRKAVIKGFDVAFRDLNQDSYKLIATSEKYQLVTDTQEIEPGQNVIIRVKAKLISR